MAAETERSHPMLQLPALPPPSHNAIVSYQDEWKKQAESVSNSKQTVLDAAFHGQHLVACTASGEISIWQVPLQQDGDGETNDANGYTQEVETSQGSMGTKIRRRKNIVVRISTGALYCIQFQTLAEKIILVVGGDEGVWTYDWADWMHFLKARNSLASPNVLTHFQPHPSVKGTPIYDCAISQSQLYAAAGDGFGCYKWDMETQKLLATYGTKQKGCGYAVRASDKTILVGGSDGSLALWDGAQDKLIEYVDVKAVLRQNESLVTTDAAMKHKWTSKTSLWISDISTTNKDWWTVSGGAHYPQSGFLATWHASTRSLVAARVTRETPQRMAQTESSLVTVADEGVVSYWSPTQLERTGRVWCSPPSSYAVAVRPQDDCAIIGGVGTQLDVFHNLTDRDFTLSLHNPSEQ